MQVIIGCGLNKIKHIYMILFLFGCSYPNPKNIVTQKYDIIGWMKDTGTQVVPTIEWHKFTKDMLWTRIKNKCMLINICLLEDCKLFEYYISQNIKNHEQYYFIKHIIDNDRDFFHSILLDYINWIPNSEWHGDELPPGYPDVPVQVYNTNIRLSFLITHVPHTTKRNQLIMFDHYLNKKEVYKYFNFFAPFGSSDAYITNNPKNIKTSCIQK